jgi:dTDP-4-dehydrorhamnose 3,5-epimerase
MLYHMSHAYVPEAARGVRWNDPAFGIEWPEADQRMISGRDQAWPDYLG